ncbi:MAG: hydrogenase iron-sulfur subunit [Proteobacteria bacterium]|nr:hydrogenase iron-sulfur subunit [Pseudomonadota bacterium]
MAPIKRALARAFSRTERVFEYAFGQRNNPFVSLGALGWYFYWIVAISGVYLYIFFDTGVTDAYASVEYMTHDQWYAAGLMRSLHRYASDALVIVVVLHIFREFAHDRLRGRRFFAWLTGVPLLAFIYICGISGYWLVWDQLAQYIALATTEWLDTLPLFGEPIANNFLNDTTLGGRFFTLMVFIHIFGPLFMLLMMWVHIQRHAGARVNPPKPLAIGTFAMLVALSFAYPAVSQAPADLDVVPAEVGLDWFYLAAYPLLDVVPGGQLWLYILGGLALLALLPWAPPVKRLPAATVDLDNCNGCTRCFDDCPFGALTMVPRTDGRAYDLEPIVDPALCTSCGICAGSCPTSTPFRRAGPIRPGIELPHHTIGTLRDQIVTANGAWPAGPRVLVVGCNTSNVGELRRSGAHVIEVPCVGMLPPSFVDFALARRHADGVMIAGCAEGDCYHRLGNEWTIARMAGERDPYLRRRVDTRRLALNWLPRDAARRRHRAFEAFRDALAEMDDG